MTKEATVKKTAEVEQVSEQVTENKEPTFQELMELVSTGKATALQKIKFSQMLAKSAQEEAENEKASKVKEIDDFIAKSGLTFSEYLKFKKPAPSNEIIFEWTDEAGKTHTKIKGTKGKWASKSVVISNLTKEKALSYAKGEDGKKFVEGLYSK
ncbi:hypothetical protein ABWL39_19965 [Chitinivorax sp. PXF-14]|uniref:hypothetical protein n=1 Tax=Chitinivorax sp. PXF-14 TaxID=3230488 RepID=UPI0034664E81